MDNSCTTFTAALPFSPVSRRPSLFAGVVVIRRARPSRSVGRPRRGNSRNIAPRTSVFAPTNSNFRKPCETTRWEMENIDVERGGDVETERNLVRGRETRWEGESDVMIINGRRTDNIVIMPHTYIYIETVERDRRSYTLPAQISSLFRADSVSEIPRRGHAAPIYIGFGVEQFECNFIYNNKANIIIFVHVARVRSKFPALPSPRVDRIL